MYPGNFGVMCLFLFNFMNVCNVYVVLYQVVFELFYFVCDAVDVVL